MFSDRVAPISGIHRVPIVPISLFDGELRIFTLWQKPHVDRHHPGTIRP